MKKLLFLLFCCYVSLNANENLYLLLKMNLTQEEYSATLQSLKRKGLAYCINTFKNDDIVLQDMVLAKQYISIEQNFEESFYKQYPETLQMKNGWKPHKTSEVAFKYTQRYINANAPFMAYYQTYAPYNKFPIPIQNTNNLEYLNSFFKSPAMGGVNYFIPCMQIYDSKEYHEYLHKVINFIVCKNCQNYTALDLQKYQTEYNEIVSISKMEGFARCITHYYQGSMDSSNNYDKMPNDIKSGYFLLSVFLSAYNWKYESDKIRTELDLHIHSAMEEWHNSVATTENTAQKSLEQPPYIFGCMQLYDSPDYQAEIERIVKKYCKDCK